MSTNDTLSGLLAECRGIVANEVAKWDRMSALLPVNSKVESGLLKRIDAALAEPVSGGVVLPERQRVKADANYNWNIGYNQALDDVAALNGGAVAGKAEHKCNICRDLGTIGYGTSCSPMILCPACTCKPLESERGGE